MADLSEQEEKRIEKKSQIVQRKKSQKKLEEKKPVIFCGDLNVAHKEIDLKNPKTNRKNAGFTDEERQKFTEVLEAGFIDTFRYFYPDVEEVYSWWSYTGRCTCFCRYYLPYYDYSYCYYCYQ